MDPKSFDLPENCENEVNEEISSSYISEYEQKMTLLEGAMNKLKSLMEKLKDQKNRECETQIEVVKKINSPDTSEIKGNSSRKISRVNTEPTLSNPSLLNYEERLSKCREVLVRTQTEHGLTLGNCLDREPYQRRLIKLNEICAEELSKAKERAHGLQSPQALPSQLKIDDEVTGVAKQETEIKDTIATPDCETNSETEDEFVYEESFLGSSTSDEQTEEPEETEDEDFTQESEIESSEIESSEIESSIEDIPKSLFHPSVREEEDDDMLLTKLFAVED